MFTINISFKDALTCFETLSDIKPTDELKSIESEFVKYARQKAKVGDSAAEAWLKNNKNPYEADNSHHDDQPSPMSFFVGMKRPELKNKQMNRLEKGFYPEDLSIIELDIDSDDHDDYYEKTKRDLPPLTRKSIEQAMKPLDKMIGLGKIKKQVRNILEGRIIEQRREKAGLKIMEATSNHMAFIGNSGTGKTTFARLLSNVFYELGFLSRGHLIEVSRSDLVGEYIGQTEQITKEILNKARGGVLFIDEAHALNRVLNSTTDFGQEVINMLLKFMEDYRDDVIIIVAGYPELMGQFLRSNPGLKSRFSHHLQFDDMEEDALLGIFKSLCTQYDYELTEDAEAVLVKVLKSKKRQEESEFPNGRGVRNLFEEVIRMQSQRLLDQNLSAKKKLKQICAEDIPSHKIQKDGNIVHLPRD